MPRAEFEVIYENETESSKIDFARIRFRTVTLMKYSWKEYRLMTLVEHLKQWDEYCTWNGIEQNKPNQNETYDEMVLPSEVI